MDEKCLGHCSCFADLSMKLVCGEKKATAATSLRFRGYEADGRSQGQLQGHTSAFNADGGGKEGGGAGGTGGPGDDMLGSSSPSRPLRPSPLFPLPLLLLLLRHLPWFSRVLPCSHVTPGLSDGC